MKKWVYHSKIHIIKKYYCTNLRLQLNFVFYTKHIESYVRNNILNLFSYLCFAILSGLPPSTHLKIVILQLMFKTMLSFGLQTILASQIQCLFAIFLPCIDTNLNYHILWLTQIIYFVELVLGFRILLTFDHY